MLVVDDEAIVRNMAESILRRRLRYKVIAACDGFEALEIFKARKELIRFVILSSGCDEAQVSRGERQEKPNAFLPKPYGIKELRMAVAESLKSGRTCE